MYDQQDGLSHQMSGMDLGQPQLTTTTKKKKKDRHAYHALEPPTQPFDAFQNNNHPNAADPTTPWMSAGQFQQQQPPPGQAQFGNGQSGYAHGQFAAQEITPAMSQFPAQVNQPFNPVASPPQPTTMNTSAQGKVDPNEIPSIPASRDAIAHHYLTNVYPTFEHHIPPPAAISFVAFDQGNSSPKFARLTINNIPSGPEALKSTGLPLGLLLQPLAPLQAGELEIPILDFGDSGPPRCHRCRAYINPFMVFKEGGNKFVCNMCTYANDVPPEYFSAITPQGARLDREQRPELMRGTVEFVVPKEYWSKTPVGLRQLFVIDVSQESIRKGFLQGFCDGILRALYGDSKDESDESGSNPSRKVAENSRVGFITFDRDIHFYNCNVGVIENYCM